MKFLPRVLISFCLSMLVIQANAGPLQAGGDSSLPTWAKEETPSGFGRLLLDMKRLFGGCCGSLEIEGIENHSAPSAQELSEFHANLGNFPSSDLYSISNCRGRFEGRSRRRIIRDLKNFWLQHTRVLDGSSSATEKVFEKLIEYLESTTNVTVDHGTKTYEEKYPKVIFHCGSDEQLASVFVLEQIASEMSGDVPALNLKWLISFQPGGGTAAISEAIKQMILSESRYIHVLALRSAIPFYEKMGFVGFHTTRTGDSTMYLSLYDLWSAANGTSLRRKQMNRHSRFFPFIQRQ